MGHERTKCTRLGWLHRGVARFLRVSGAWVFFGTRVPVAALLKNLEDEISVTDLVELFPGVTQEQARLVPEHAARGTATAPGL